jgi:hypothetical protein
MLAVTPYRRERLWIHYGGFESTRANAQPVPFHAEGNAARSRHFDGILTTWASTTAVFRQHGRRGKHRKWLR